MCAYVCGRGGNPKKNSFEGVFKSVNTVLKDCPLNNLCCFKDSPPFLV